MNHATLAFWRLAIAGVLAWAGQAGAALNDVFPADFVALPEGRGTTTFYLFDRRQDGPWAKDQQVGELSVDSAIGAVRFNRFYRLGGWKVSPILVVSGVGMAFSGRSVPPGVSRERSGLADLRVGGTVWLIDAPESRHYLGLNLMTVWPSGRYQGSEIANPGENRRRHSLMLGWVKGLGDDLTLDLTPELAWYGDNDDGYPGNVRVTQRRTASLTAYLRYRFSADWQGFIGWQANEGGETRVNGADQHNPIHGRREFIGGRYVVDKDHSLNLRLAHDRSVANGLRTAREVALRWVWAY